MKAKDFLLQIKKLDKLIENKLIEKEQWKAIAKGITVKADGERVQSSGSKQKMADAVGKYVDIDAEIDRYIDELVDKKNDIISVIEQLPVHEYDLLHKMYVGIMEKDDDENDVIVYLELCDLVTLLDMSYSKVTKLHGYALKHVQNIIDKRAAGE